MPNGIYPVPPIKTRKDAGRRSAASRPGIGLRLRTWWRRDHLDEQLADGTDPSRSADLALRAEQLRSDAERTRLAKALEAIVRETREPPTMSSPPVRHGDVYACADELLLLAHRLRESQPVTVRGAALAAVFVSDVRSPLYYKTSVPLWEAARSARFALDELDESSVPAVRPSSDWGDRHRRGGALEAVETG